MRATRAGPQGHLDFQVTTRHYSVRGSDLSAAYRSMRATNPGGFAGWARWNVRYTHDKKVEKSDCAISSLTVHVTGEIMMPEWAEEKSAKPAEQSAWRTMYANLKRHEDGHIQHGREFALLLKERLLGMGFVPCSELESRMRQEHHRLYGNLKSRDAEYDRRTEHGLRQDNPR